MMKPTNKTRLPVALAFCLLCSLSAYGHADTPPGMPEGIFDPEKYSRLARSRAWLGEKINATNQGLDGFFMKRMFGDSIVNSELDINSQARMLFEVGSTERRGQEADIGLDIRLTLPHTKQHLKFIASSSEDDDTPLNEALLEDSKQRNGFFTGFQYIADSVLNWKSSAKLGLKWSRSPELFLEGRIQRRFGSDEHHISFSHAVAYYTRRRLINTTQINYFKRFSPDWAFHLRNQLRHFDSDQYYAFNYTPGLLHRINSHNAMTYELRVAGDDIQHPYVDRYTASVRWRRRIHSSWLFIEVEPMHTYFVAPQINNTPRSEAALFLRLEVLINNI